MVTETEGDARDPQAYNDFTMGYESRVALLESGAPRGPRLVPMSTIPPDDGGDGRRSYAGEGGVSGP
jgi:hypothetical protein